METIYVETTVVSYLVSEPSRDLVVAGHQQITSDWWEHHRQAFTCLVSQLVLDEAAGGDAEQASKRIAVLRELASVPVTPEAIALAENFVTGCAVPPKAGRDALHVAVATVHRLDYLATWNCRHIANAQVLKRLRHLSALDGYELPIICTPEELLGDASDET
jgi:hypothetical protein